MTDIMFELSHYFKSIGDAKAFLNSLNNIGIDDNYDFVGAVDECDSITTEPLY